MVKFNSSHPVTVGLGHAGHPPAGRLRLPGGQSVKTHNPVRELAVNLWARRQALITRAIDHAALFGVSMPVDDALLDVWNRNALNRRYGVVTREDRAVALGIDLPDLDARRTILALHLTKRGRDPKAYELSILSDACRGFSGAELEQVVVAALHRAFALGREPTDADLRHVARDVVPLSRTYAEQIKELRDWARGRARTAGREGAIVDLFRRAHREAD